MALFLLFCVIWYLPDVGCLDNGLALTPPMGWLSWERFQCNLDCVHDPDNCISENLYMAMADRLVEDGYKDVGYEYVNIDDCWSAKERAANGTLLPDPVRFPSGIKALADYVHSKGLKLGIYGDFGTKTCGGYPGSEFYLELDAQTFARWGVDSLKFDGCNSQSSDMPYGYPAMGLYLNRTGRPILYSCEWPGYMTHPDYVAVAKTCNLWRNYYDIEDSYTSVTSIVNHYGENTNNFSGYAGPGGWNDPDMLILGDFSLSYYQQRLQMAMWAIMASPLHMSNDLRNIRPESKAILQNKNVIAINQDPLGIQGTRVDMFNSIDSKDGNIQVWTKQLVHQNYAIAVVKLLGPRPSKLSLHLDKYGLKNSAGYNITEVFTGDHVTLYKPGLTLNININPADVTLLKATKL